MAEVRVRVTFIAHDVPDNAKKLYVLGNCPQLADRNSSNRMNLLSDRRGKVTLTLNMQLHQNGNLKVDDLNHLQIRIAVTPVRLSENLRHLVPLNNAIPDHSMLQFDVHVYFNGAVRVEPILGYYQFPTNSTKNYLCSLANALGIQGEVFAQYLVPAITIKGKYNKTFLSSRPSELHNIWGDAALNNNESAIQHIQKRCVQDGPVAARNIILTALNNEYHRRDRKIFGQFEGHVHFPFQLPLDVNNHFLQRAGGDNLNEDDFFKLLMNLGEQIDIQNGKQAKFLLAHAHAIIRGRLEAFSAAPNFNLMSQNFDAAWQSHMRAVSAWFVFLIRVFKTSRILGLVKIGNVHKDFITSPDQDPWYGPPLIPIGLLGAVNAIVDTPINGLNSFPLHHKDKLPRENVLQYLYQRAGFDPTLSVDEIKYVYAQSLVPLLRNDGFHDQRLNLRQKRIVRKLYDSHLPLHMANRVAYLPRLLEQLILRQNNVNNGLMDNGQVMTLKQFISSLCLIIAGRMEHVTLMQVDLFKENDFQTWREAIRLAGDWFKRLMAVLRNNGMLDFAAKSRRKNEFFLCLTVGALEDL